MNDDHSGRPDEHDDHNDGIVVRYGSRTYVWNGVNWFDQATHLIPPSETIHKLNHLLQEKLRLRDAMLRTTGEIVAAAVHAKNAEQYERAERLARQALSLSRRNVAAATVLSSVLRAMGRPDEAVAATEPFSALWCSPLLTTRAAALCDLAHWDEALRTIRRALAASRGSSPEPFAVHRRIRSEAPELF